MGKMASNAYFKTFPRGLDIQLSENFHLREFECHCGKCPETIISMLHVARLQKLRNDFGQPIKINSAYRCFEHNKAVGGVPGSQHTLGLATDLALPLPSYAYLKQIFDALIIYDTFCHVDSRGYSLLLDKRVKK
jgi:hypothetical protein